jgi:outer membrane lipoprotein-sorting protein
MLHKLKNLINDTALLARIILCGLSFLVILGQSLPTLAAAATPNPTELIRAAINYWRGKSSYTEINMTIHRPDWERTSSMQGWTRGEKDTLIRFTKPTQDAGNATLKLGDAMWMFTPKLNRVMKLPFSMMAQSWMGSDFSYNDLAKSDQVLYNYTHHILNTETQDEHTIYTIESIPKPEAPVVWGKEVLKIRDDYILMAENFFDQDLQMVKQLTTLKIAPLGNKTAYPVQMRMTTLTEPEQWTEIQTVVGSFDLDLPDYLFTQSNLRNPRPWQTP